MNLFTNELFNRPMLQAFAADPPRSYRTPAFGRRYGHRHNEELVPVRSTPVLLALAVERIGDEKVLLRYGQAA
jgi:hypothetical protein